MYDFDVISIGAGSGGCASAMRCADLGKKVALVERNKNGTGGTCVNRGCIPTKVLVKSAEVFNQAKKAQQFGIKLEGITADQKAIHQQKVKAINSLKFGLDNLLIKPRKITRIQGNARFLDAHTLEITDGDKVQQVTAEHIIIATGSEPAMIPAFHIDGKNIITSNEALNLQEIPKSMVVIGAGALGLEFSYIFSTFGCKVTIAEMMPHVVPNMKDDDVTGEVQKYLEKTGVSVKAGKKIQSIDVKEEGCVVCSFEDGETVEAEKALVAIGRSLNTKGLGLEELGIEMTPKGQIVTNEHMQTNIPNIYAAGDITDKGPQLSHKAQKQGLVAAEHIAGQDSTMHYDVIPWAIFMQPEIAGVGMTAADAQAKGIETIVGKLPFSANEKAMSMQATVGLMKVVARKDNGKIIGGQIFGVDASVLIEEIALAMDKGLTMEDVAGSIHAHPTVSELVMETCKQGLGKAFHK
jgi:dihydrolipoamide dehydrogenase